MTSLNLLTFLAFIKLMNLNANVTYNNECFRWREILNVDYLRELKHQMRVKCEKKEVRTHTFYV